MIGGGLVLAQAEIWGSHASLIVFLALYFGFLWVSWVLAVWATEPKKANPAASNEQDAGSAGPG
jgi:hypothetical protein